MYNCLCFHNYKYVFSDHVQIKFPADFKKSSVGTAINQFLGKLRRDAKGKAEVDFV